MSALIVSPCRPVVLDLCCGLGGWSRGFAQAGWSCVGLDVMDYADGFPGEFIQADVLRWQGWRTRDISAVIASPPCEQFSRHSMPWLRRFNPPSPFLALANHCRYVGLSLGVPWMVENVRGAQAFLGRSDGSAGPYHFWGNVPLLLPCGPWKSKSRNYDGKSAARRALIPLELSVWVGRVWKVGLE